MQSALLQIQGLFQSQFSRDGNRMLPLSNYDISFPLGHPVSAYNFFFIILSSIPFFFK
jgi:hypothetical protein